jgi:hypothetical protein
MHVVQIAIMMHHAMCDIQNSAIPLVNLIQLRKVSIKNLHGTDVLNTIAALNVES